MLDGPAAAARFDAPWGIAADATGTLFVSDTGNDRVRRIDPSGAVSTFAGGDGSLDAPMGIAVDATGNVYVADSGNQRVVRYSPQGALELLAGTGTAGVTDGHASSATFSALAGLAFSEAYAGGGLLIGDGHRVRLLHCP
jgi:DNA-binding beta-propeller fold protein YncE